MQWITDRNYDIDYLAAVEQADGSYLNEYGDITWYDNEEGRRHREDGPAVIRTNGKLFWYLNGVYLPFKRWLLLTPISDEQKMLLRLQYA